MFYLDYNIELILILLVPFLYEYTSPGISFDATSDTGVHHIIVFFSLGGGVADDYSIHYSIGSN